MSSRIVEITTDGRHLAAERGFMTVSEDGREVARVPLDDIAAVIACAHGITYSNNLLVQLSRRNALLVVCGSNFVPSAFLWALEGNYTQSSRMDAQIEATAPKRKNLWKQIVIAKIIQQAAVLEGIGVNWVPLRALARNVRSGDPENVEAQAARRYWPLVFGQGFRRDRNAGGVNSLLNYGYMVVRSAVARAVMGAGLHPSIGIHHCNAGNPMRLVDDLMEPFRPYVDFVVWNLRNNGMEQITPMTKRKLAAVLEMNVAAEAGMTALRNAVQNAATSLALVYEGKKENIDFPLPQPPLWLEVS